MRDYVHSHPFEGPESDITKGFGGPNVTFEGYMPRAGPLSGVEPVSAEGRGDYGAVHAERRDARGGGARESVGRRNRARTFSGLNSRISPLSGGQACRCQSGSQQAGGAHELGPRLPGLRIAQTVIATLGAIMVMSAPAWPRIPPPDAVTFSKDVAPILQAKCQECHQPNSIAPMSLITLRGSAALGALDQAARRDAADAAVAHRPSVGVQKFKNDMSLSDEQIDTIVRWVDAGAPRRRSEGHAAAQAARHRQRMAGRARRLRPARHRRSSRPSTRCRRKHQDVWYRPMSDIPLTEPRWARMVEIRPTNLKGRKIVHHSIAYLVLNNDPDAVNTGTANGSRRGADRRPTISSTAVRS